MSTPTSPLYWNLRSTPRGTECYFTGVTLTVGSSGFTYTVPSSETNILKRLTVIMESGVTFTDVTFDIPNMEIPGSQPQSHVFNQRQFNQLCGGSKELNGTRQDKFLPESGITYYKFDLEFKPPVLMKYADAAHLTVYFGTIAGGAIHVQPEIWRVPQDYDGV